MIDIWEGSEAELQEAMLQGTHVIWVGTTEKQQDQDETLVFEHSALTVGGVSNSAGTTRREARL